MVTRSRVVSFVTGAALVASLFGALPIAQAATLTPEQITAITNLLQSFNADASAIANVQAVLSGTASTTFGKPPFRGDGEHMLPPPAGACATIATNLKRGSSGDDVMRLQSYLGIASTTGFFGPKTEEAVGRWQVEHNIIATGTPPVNGFGVVGPKTRQFLNGEMEGRCGKGKLMMGSSTQMMPPRPEDRPMMGSSTGPVGHN